MKPIEFSEMKLEALLPERPVRSNKATFGKLLCAAGSYCMSGAAYLAAKAAYRTGAGLVKVLTPEENRIIIQSSLPEALISVYDSGCFDEKIAVDAVRWADVVAIGPGIGTSDAAVSLLATVLRNSVSPVVIDADGLNILAMKPKLWERVPIDSIITPHPGEMSRLCGCSVDEILSDLPAVCQGFARAKGVICVLKDHATAVSDGEELYINSTGNSGMATGGSGDVLTGMIAALMAQGMPPFAAAAVGVRAHGMAGDAAAEALGEYSVMASDIIDSIPKVLKGKR